MIDILIIGAGIAGAAAARELARRGADRIAILEKEILPGAHASGRNAALILQNVTDEVGITLGREGARFYADPPPDLPLPIRFQKSGSLLLASGPGGVGRMQRDTEQARRHGIPVEILSPEEARRKVPLLEADQFAGAAFCPDDGVLDIDALTRSFLADAECMASSGSNAAGCSASARSGVGSPGSIRTTARSPAASS